MCWELDEKVTVTQNKLSGVQNEAGLEKKKGGREDWGQKKSTFYTKWLMGYEWLVDY